MPYVTTWERKAMEVSARNKEIEIAKKLVRKGISLDIISEATGLSQSEIESLKVEQPVH